MLVADLALKLPQPQFSCFNPKITTSARARKVLLFVKGETGAFLLVTTRYPTLNRSQPFNFFNISIRRTRFIRYFFDMILLSTGNPSHIPTIKYFNLHIQQIKIRSCFFFQTFVGCKSSFAFAP